LEVGDSPMAVLCFVMELCTDFCIKGILTVEKMRMWRRES
jgi:hypothetical protein